MTDDRKESQGKASPGAHRNALTDEERLFLTGLLTDLAEEDRPACDALLRANPELIDECHTPAELAAKIRATLTGTGGTPLSQEQQQLIERTKDALAEIRSRRHLVTPLAAAEEDAGVLTSLTRQLSPAKAAELYRKIMPAFVYQVLDRLNRSASLHVVHQIVGHLCSDEVQAQLRTCEHVRDAILDEFRDVLGQSEIHQQVSRADLQKLLVECGVMNDLIALENCIKLVASKAG